MTGPLSSRLATLCHEIVTEFGSGAGGQVRQIGERLHEPLRVAIAGRLKAGKSTLVNALIGRRVAPTAAGECTRVVTRFRYGPADRVDIVTRDGNRRSLPLDDDGMIPARLGVPATTIAYLDVTLTDDRLRELTVVDTPGLSSTDHASSRRARHAVGHAPFDDGIDADSTSEIAAAEAVIYVFTQAVRADDVHALHAFHDASARLAASPVNALGVLAKIDTLAGGPDDPWPIAVPLAADQARLLHRTVSDVVPLAGLLAETAGAGRLTGADRDSLTRLATLPGPDLRLLLTSVDLFRTLPAPLDAERRERLLTRLDLYGIGYACAQLAAEPHLSTGELVRRLLAASGLPRLHHTLRQCFSWRADAIKAGWALTRLERIAGHTSDPRLRAAVRDRLETALRDPAYHRLRLLDAAQRAATGAVTLPADRETDLIRLATSDDPRTVLQLPHAAPDELAAAAITAAAGWRAYAVDGAGPAQARLAHIAHRGYQLLAQEVRRCAS
ncbi:dynamin family protein [Actinoplanes teichomyceticus]|uniref:Dynamin family protein n=1 Tax=Actinoplanes teichomyceticus TaxID=1867 RepID=A0A561VMF1_ACTTI|nr:dynamin family protein [Actinoplanes teichomyceticus]GIF13511.1 isoniazid inducible gene protein IniC [Actinoplanes teichomyceticus]